MTQDLARTEKSRLRRSHDRGFFDRKTVDTILDAQPMCSVGYIIDDAPYVTPTMQWREGNYVYWHGSSASRAIRKSREMQVCVTVSILDGFVMARSGFHHSVNSRSVMLFGKAEIVPTDETEARLTNFIEMLWPGRAAAIRPNTAQELKATTLLRLPIAEGSAKIRTGAPIDDEEDYELPIWAGVIPVKTVVGDLIPDERNLDGAEPPKHITDFNWSP